MPRTTVQGRFRHEAELDRAVQALTNASFDPQMIHVDIITPTPGKRRFDLQLLYRSGDLTGGLLGASAGVVIGLVVAFLVVEGVLRPAWLVAFLDVGLGQALFRGAVVGAAILGLAGGIIGFGWWTESPPTKHEAKLYLLTVDTVDRASEALEILHRHSSLRA